MGPCRSKRRWISRHTGGREDGRRCGERSAGGEAMVDKDGEPWTSDLRLDTMASGMRYRASRFLLLSEGVADTGRKDEQLGRKCWCIMAGEREEGRLGEGTRLQDSGTNQTSQVWSTR